MQEASLVFEWEHAGRSVSAEIDPEGATTIESGGRRATADGDSRRGMSLGGSISFEVRDGVAAVVDDGRKVIASLEIGTSDISVARGSPPGQPCRVAIEARGFSKTGLCLDAVLLSRDVSYRSDMGTVSWPVRLGPDDLFILGDNSAAAADSRFAGPHPRSAVMGVPRWLFAPASRWRVFD